MTGVLHVLTIARPGSTKLARFSFSATRSGGILLIIPGIWLMLFLGEASIETGEAREKKGQAFSSIALIFFGVNCTGILKRFSFEGKSYKDCDHTCVKDY